MLPISMMPMIHQRGREGQITSSLSSWSNSQSGGIMEAMLPTALAFPRTLYDEMVAHVLSNPAEEMCGLLSGQDGVVDRVWPVPNALASPTAYRMDGPEFATAMIGCEFEPLGIFHSHPAGPPVPSPTDIAQAAYPDC